MHTGGDRWTEGQAPIHYSEKLQTAEQAGRLTQQDIRSGTGQLFFPAESPHRAGTGYAGVVGGMDIHIRVPDIDRRLRTRPHRFQRLKKGGRDPVCAAGPPGLRRSRRKAAPGKRVPGS